MRKLWLKNKKLIIGDGKATQCTKCPCTLDLCDLTLSNAGGDEGYAADIPLDESTEDTPIGIRFVSYYVKDRLVICTNPTTEIPSGTITDAAISGTVLYDSGCIGTGSDPEYQHLNVPAGTTIVRVIVIPNCQGTTGTAWNLKVVCCCPCDEEGAEECCPCYDEYLLWKAVKSPNFALDAVRISAKTAAKSANRVR